MSLLWVCLAYPVLRAREGGNVTEWPQATRRPRGVGSLSLTTSSLALARNLVRFRGYLFTLDHTSGTCCVTWLSAGGKSSKAEMAIT